MLTNTSVQMRFLINVVKADKTAVLVYRTACLSVRVCVCLWKTHINMPQTQTGIKRLLVRSQAASQAFPSIHASLIDLLSENHNNIGF